MTLSPVPVTKGVRLLIGALLLLATSLASAAFEPLTDPSVSISQGRALTNPFTGAATAAVVVENGGDSAIGGAFRLVVANSNRAVSNADGVNTAGEPYFAIPTGADGLAAGTATSIAIGFQRGRGRIIYQTRVDAELPDGGTQPVATPASLDLGTAFVGLTASGTLSIGNPGTAPLVLTTVTIDDPAFTVAGALPLTIPAGASGSLPISFSPDQARSFSGLATLAFDTADPLDVPLSGVGEAPAEAGAVFTVDTLDFGTVPAPGAATGNLSIDNIGNGPLTVSAAAITDATAFALAPDVVDRLPLRIPPGGAEPISVELSTDAADAGGGLSGKLALTTDDPDHPTRTVLLTATAVTPPDPRASTVLDVQVDPASIGAADCSSVNAELLFGPDSTSSDRAVLYLRDEQGAMLSSAEVAASAGSGSVQVPAVDVCALADGAIEPVVAVASGGEQLPNFTGAPAVKNAGPLAAPVLDDTETLVTLEREIRLCGRARSQTLVDIKGGARSVSVELGAGETDFCLDVPLRPNAENLLIASATENTAGVMLPLPVASAPALKVIQINPAEIVVATVDSRPLTVDEIEALVDNGVIDLEDPSNFHHSLFTIVLNIGLEPVTISTVIPVPPSPSSGGTSGSGGSGGTGGGHVYYGVGLGGGGGGFSGGGGGYRGFVIVPPVPPGQPQPVIPGVIIIDGVIKTLKELFQVTLAIDNLSTTFDIEELVARIQLPAGLSAVRAGPGSDPTTISVDDAEDTVTLGTIPPGERGEGQFVVRGDKIGEHAVSVGFSGFLTGGGLPEPLAFDGEAGTSLTVHGPPELEVTVGHPSDPSDWDVIAGEIYTLTVDITNTSDRPALYTSLMLKLGADARLVDADDVPIPGSIEVRDFGHVQPGQTVSAAFRVEPMVTGEIIACQAVASENLTLSIDTGPDPTACSVANTIPADFSPPDPAEPPSVLAISPLNGAPNNVITSTAFAVFTPPVGCLTADTFTNPVTNGAILLDADFVAPGTFYMEQLDDLGAPVRRVPVELHTTVGATGATTVAVLRPGLASPNTQLFLEDGTTYRVTAVGGPNGICNAVTGEPLANDFTWTFSTERGCTLPQLEATLARPADGGLDQPRTGAIRMEFTNRIDPTTVAFAPGDLAGSSFGVYADATESAGQLLDEGTVIAGNARFDGSFRRLTFQPAQPLPADSTITVRLTDALQDTCGNPLSTPPVGERLFTFQTEAEDAEAPALPQVNPLPSVTSAASILVSGSAEPEATVAISGGTAPVTTTAGEGGSFSARVGLAASRSTLLSVAATDASGNRSPDQGLDTAGNPLLVFRDATAPAVVSVDPADGFTGVPVDTAIRIALSEAIDPASVQNSDVELLDALGNAVTGALALEGTDTLVLTPGADLAVNRVHDLELRAGSVRDLAGNPLAGAFGSSFTTAGPVIQAPALTTLSPDTGLRGTALVVTFGGDHLSSITGVTSDNPGVAGTLVSVGETAVSANVTIADDAAVGSMSLGLSGPGGSAALPFTVAARTPEIDAIAPSAGIQGTTVDVRIDGRFLADVTGITISGSGVALTDLGGDATHRDLRLDIDPAAATGTRTITLTTIGGSVNAGFQVVPNSLTLSPSPLALTTHANADLTVGLGAPAGVGGVTVTLTNPDPALVTLASSVEIPEGVQNVAMPVTSAGSTGSVTVTAAATGFDPVDGVVQVAARDFTLDAPRIGLNRSVTLSIELDQPAPAGGVVIELSVDDPGLVAVSPASVSIPAGQTSGQATLSGGANVGSTVLTADGSASGLAVKQMTLLVSDRLIDIPAFGEMALGEERDINVLISPDAAPAGGTQVQLVSSDPGVVEVVTPTVTVPEGAFFTTATIRVVATAPGSAVITASNPDLAPDSSTAQVTAGLDIFQGVVSFQPGESRDIHIGLASGGLDYPAPAPGETIDLDTSDATCVDLAAGADVVTGESLVTVALSDGGSTVHPCTATVTASHPVFGTDSVEVTVGQTPDLGSLSVSGDTRIGAALQSQWTLNLGRSDHGGVTVQLDVGDPALARVAPDADTPGQPAIEVFVPDGTASVSFYVQGVVHAEGATEVRASNVRFAPAAGSVDIAPATFGFHHGLTGSHSVTTIGTIADDNFSVRTGVLNADGTGIVAYQGVSAAAAPLTVTATSSDPSVAALRTSVDQGASVAVQLGANQTYSYSSDYFWATFPTPPVDGTTTLSVSAPGFVPLSQTVSVSVSSPTIAVGGLAARIGAALQDAASFSLSGGNHGGVTVRVSSSDPATALIAPDASTPGAAFIDVTVPDGQTSGSFVVQGVAGASGAVTLTLSHALFQTREVDTQIVQPVLQLDNLPTSIGAAAADDPYRIYTGIANTSNTGVETYQEVAPGQGPVQVLLTSSDGTVALNRTLAAHGTDVTIEVEEGSYLSAGTVADGGVALDPQTAGSTVIRAQSLDFNASFPGSAQTVTVTP